MAQVRHGNRYYKQMALEVATRNPERLEGILRVFSKFEGVTLDDDAILDIYSQLYIDKTIVSSAFDLQTATEDEIRRYVRTRTHNNEWGFPTGYQAAFVRYLKTLSEFGFIYSQYNEALLLSPVSKALLSGKISLSEAFALQSMRFWRKSPYRRVLNDFNYFKFILEVIDRLNECGHRLSYNQFLLSLFVDNSNVDDFLATISTTTFINEDEVYDYVLNNYSRVDREHGVVCKQSTSFNDYGDSVFRLLQLTGFITIEYSGTLLLSINNNRRGLLDELMNFDFSLPEEAYDNEKIYFETLGSFDTSLYSLILRYRDQQRRSVAEYNIKIQNIIDSYELTEDVLAQYIQEVSDGKRDTRIFNFLQAPLKFEFLISLYLYLCLGDEYEYKPNYLCDEAGIPYSHAPGNIGDIEVYNSARYWLIEVTLIRGKNQQINNETINLFRHIDSERHSAKYMSLIAPYIHEDTELLIKVASVISMLESKDLLFAMPFKTEEFISSMKENNCLTRIRENSQSFFSNLRDFVNTVCISYDSLTISEQKHPENR